VETPYLTAAPDAAMKALLDPYRAIAVPIANRVIGSITADIKRNSVDSTVESALGDVIADAQLEATAKAAAGGAVVAMTNPGGIRTDLTYYPPNGDVTYGQVFAVQPFSNTLVTMSLTGAQLKAVLEQQAAAARTLQISASLTYTWTKSAAVESKVSNLMINGVAVDPTAVYRVTVNNFLAAGGDGFTRLTAGTDLFTGGVDLDAFVNYITDNSPVAPGPMNRITVLP
jgi:5'-nucleotidase